MGPVKIIGARVAADNCLVLNFGGEFSLQAQMSH